MLRNGLERKPKALYRLANKTFLKEPSETGITLSTYSEGTPRSITSSPDHETHDETFRDALGRQSLDMCSLLLSPKIQTHNPEAPNIHCKKRRNLEEVDLAAEQELSSPSEASSTSSQEQFQSFIMPKNKIPRLSETQGASVSLQQRCDVHFSYRAVGKQPENSSFRLQKTAQPLQLGSEYDLNGSAQDNSDNREFPPFERRLEMKVGQPNNYTESSRS
jgi:hypothetical protein